MAIFLFFFKWRPPPCWILKILHLQLSERSKVQNYVIMPNFVEIARTAAELSHFFDFSKWRPPLSWVYKFLIFNGRSRQDGRTASMCEMSTESLQLRPTYDDFLFFNLGVSRFEIFNGRNGQEGQTASLCQISSKSLEPRPRYVSFNIMLYLGLKMPIHGPFLGGGLGTFSPNDVTHRPNPKKPSLG